MTDVPDGWQPSTLIYWHSGHEITTRLRGLDLYRAVALVALGDRADGYDGDVVRDGNEFDVFGNVACHLAEECPRADHPGHLHPFHVYASYQFRSRRQEESARHPYVPSATMVRVINPGNAGVVKLLSRLRADGAAILVDVTMPICSPELIIGFEPPDSPLHQLDNEANRELWRPGGEAHTALLAAMHLAHVVTVNNEQTALDAITVNPSVMVVPDLHTDGDEPEGTNQSAVMDALGAAQNRALRLAHDPHGERSFLELLRRWL